MILEDNFDYSENRITQSKDNIRNSSTLPSKSNAKLNINKIDKFYTLSSKRNNVKILKSFYNKDASESVNKSFLTINDKYHNSQTSFESINSSCNSGIQPVSDKDEYGSKLMPLSDDQNISYKNTKYVKYFHK